MPAFGQYHSLTEVHWSRDSTVYSAVSASGKDKRKFAIKVRRFPDTDLNAALFESASIQKAASEAGGKHLAPIFESGITHEGCAWYVTQDFESSLLEFLKARNAATPVLLSRITDDILAGLEELWRAHERPHGNLKAANVLLEGTDARNLQAKLADPAAEVEEIDSAGDLFRLGEIVYQLVRRSARVVTILPPLERTAEWDEYGEAWLDFANRLFNRRANEAPDALAILRGHLRKLRKAPIESTATRKSLGGYWKIAAGVLLLGGGAITARYLTDIHKKAEPPIVTTTSDDRIRAQKALDLCNHPPEEIAKDPYLMGVFDRLKTANPDRNLLNTLVTETSADKWPAKQTLDQAYNKYAKKDWQQSLCKELLEARADLDVSGDKDLASQLTATVKKSNLVETIDGDWLVAKNLFDQWTEPQNEVLLLLKDWAERRMRDQKDLQAAAQEVPNICDKLLLANRRATSDEWKSQFSRRRFRADSSAARRIQSDADWFSETGNYMRPDESDLKHWRTRVADFKVALTVLTALPADQQESARSSLNKIDQLLDDPIKSDRDFMEVAFVELDKLLKPAPARVTSIPPASGPTMPPPTPTPTATPAPQDIALTKWLHNLLNQATIQTPAKDFLAIFDTLSADPASGPGSHQDLQNQLRALIKPQPPAPPALSAPWKLASEKGPPYVFQYLSKDKSGRDFRYGVPFVFIQPSHGQSFYMAGIELPLGLALMSDKMPATNPLDDRGPQVWRGGQPAASWEWKKAEIGRLGAAKFYAAKTSPTPPSLFTPLNAITGTDAWNLAQSLQCSLPTFDQWKAASAYAAPNPPQLRGSLWKDQFTYWQDIRDQYALHTRGDDAGGNIPWPDDNSYTSKPNQHPLGNHDDQKTPPQAENLSLWFRSVYANLSPKNPIYSYIYDYTGNVAQFVLDKEDDTEHFFAVGGSAISDPSAGEKVPVDRRKPFSDVGIRLVAKMSSAPPGDELLAFRQRVQDELTRLEKPVTAAQ